MQDFTVISMAGSMNSCASPIPSSVDSLDLDQEEEALTGPLDPWQNYLQHRMSPNATSQQQHQESTPNAIFQQPHITVPPQKRRRVARACDECRRKKIKCDGKQSCTHCTVYNYDCTYDQPSNRRRNPTPQYIEALENRLRRAEALLNAKIPNSDPNDPGIDKLIQLQHPVNSTENPETSHKSKDDGLSTIKETESKLYSMVESTGGLELDGSGNWDFHGESSGVVFLKRMQENISELLVDEKASLISRIPRICVTQIHEFPKSFREMQCDPGFPKSIELPSRKTAESLCEVALCQGCSLLQFVHLPTFHRMLERVYELPYDKFEEADHSFLILLFVTLSVGCLFNDSLDEDTNDSERPYTKSMTDKGLIPSSLKYFKKARSMINITDCQNLMHLQAIIFMVLFHQSLANISKCYSYIGIAQRAALQMGLHRNLPDKFNPVERETRRRVFWVIRKLDICISAMLGFPELLSHEDIDQEMPIEVDDEFITKSGVLSVPGAKPSLPLQAANAHARLMFTLAKVLKYMYPIKGLEESLNGQKMSGYMISHAKILEIEQDLTNWLENLPARLRPGGEEDLETIRQQQLLRLSYAHVQMMLYRPFLLYVSKKSTVENFSCKKSLACAAACINVSRNIVHITTDMKNRGLLIGAHWLVVYTTYFAILSLVYFVLENTDASGSPDILRDANSGKDNLSGLARKSEAAEKCSSALKDLFEKLPEKLKISNNLSFIAKKKRSTSSSMNENDTSYSIESSEYPSSGIELTLQAKISSISSNSQVLLESEKGAKRDSLLSVPIPKTEFDHNSHEPSSPVNSPKIKTPILSCPKHAIHPPNYSSQLKFNYNFHDLNSGIFSSPDSFAYQSQPIIDFENIKHGSDVIMMDNSQQSMILSNNPHNRDRINEDISGQLIRALPPFLTPGLNGSNIQSSLGTENLMSSTLNQTLNFHDDISHLQLPNNMDFYPVDGEVWNNIVDDQRYGH